MSVTVRLTGTPAKVGFMVTEDWLLKRRPDYLLVDTRALGGFRKFYRKLPVAGLFDRIISGRLGYQVILARLDNPRLYQFSRSRLTGHQVGHAVQFHPPAGQVEVAHFLALAQKAAGFDLSASVGEDRIDGVRNPLAVLGVESDEYIGPGDPLGRQTDQVLQIPVPPYAVSLAVQHEEDAGDGVDHVR